MQVVWNFVQKLIMLALAGKRSDIRQPFSL